ncbi:MAG: M56 family metallopeptidase, partial [Lachnospiraceae bacterium]|nr:M56 family metallopeptidase [Lachnospiraceae bacterium]
MSNEILSKGFAALLMSAVFAWVVFDRYDTDTGSENTDPGRQRYLPYVPGSLLPLFLISIAVISLFCFGGQKAAHLTLSMCFGIFLHISLYYLVLLLTLPLFRRHFSARACAILWMIPNYLYITEQNYMKLPMPLIIIQAPGRLVWILFTIWLLGFVAVLGFHIFSHLVFRFRILKDAAIVSDPAVLALWEEEIELAAFKNPRFQLMTSPHVAAPLSIGLFRRKIRVVLPDRAYSPDELALIFRHEIVHIGREDSWSKFFLLFCTAMCWFNPLMWTAMQKSADDMELSCDETVLIHTDDTTRRRYANLLLKTAGDAHGFTTCLSASAASMRYRLKNVVKPPKKHSGALIVGIVFFLLCMSCGYVALAYGGGTGAELIYQSRDSSRFRLRYITRNYTTREEDLRCADEASFHAYMASLKMNHLTGNYSFNDSQREEFFLYDTPEGTLAVILYDEVLKLAPIGEKSSASKSEYYYLPDGTDWAYLDTLIVPNPALKLHIQEPGNTSEITITANLVRLEQTE